MEMSLADRVPGWCMKKAFDSVRRGVKGSRANVDRAINDAVTAITQDTYEFEGAIVDEGTNRGGTRAGRHISVRLKGLREGSLGKEEGRRSLAAKGINNRGIGGE
jgi:hypothetical protein